MALGYRPAPLAPAVARARPVLSVVTVVDGNDPAALARGLESWLAAGVHEIIVLIGADDEPCQRVIEHYPVTVIRRRPQLHADLRAGWQAASGDLVALAEPGTIWARDVSVRVAAAFQPGVGAVAVRQNAYDVRGVLHRYDDMNLDIQAFGPAAAGSRLGRAAGDVWGATAVFRRQVLLEVEDQCAAIGRTATGSPVAASGRTRRGTGDRLAAPGERLAELVLRQGLGAVFQRSARVWTSRQGGISSLLAGSFRRGVSTFAIRSDGERLPGSRRPYRAASRFAAALAGPATLIGIGYAGAAVRAGAWGVLLTLAGWVVVTRAVLLLPHLWRRPSSLLALPVHVLVQSGQDVALLAGHLAGLTAASASAVLRLLPGRRAGADDGTHPQVIDVDAAPEQLVIDPALQLRPVRRPATELESGSGTAESAVPPVSLPQPDAARLVVQPRLIPAAEDAAEDAAENDAEAEAGAVLVPEPAGKS